MAPAVVLSTNTTFHLISGVTVIKIARKIVPYIVET